MISDKISPGAEMRERIQWPGGRIRGLGILAVLGACATPGGEASHPISPTLEAGSRTAVVGGVEHWYRVAGECSPGAVPVLFLHGGPGEGSDRFATPAGCPALRSSSSKTPGTSCTLTPPTGSLAKSGGSSVALNEAGASTGDYRIRGTRRGNAVSTPPARLYGCNVRYP